MARETFSEIILSSKHWRCPLVITPSDDTHTAKTLPKHQIVGCIATGAIATIATAVIAVPVCLAIKSTLILTLAVAATIVAVASAVAIGIFASYAAAAYFKTQTCEMNSNTTRRLANLSLASDQQASANTEPTAPQPNPASPNVSETMLGIPNIGSSCWLNSTLKFLCKSTDLQALFQPLGLSLLQANAQNLLKGATQKLRDYESLTNDSCRLLRNSLNCIFTGCTRGPQDAEEFLISLFNEFLGYNPVLNLFPNASDNQFTFRDSLQQEITMGSLANHSATRSNELPENLYVKPARSLPLALDADGTITIYTVANTCDEICCHKYKIEAAIKNTGGHWVFYERKDDLRVILHDDHRVTASNFQTMSTSNLFLLRRINAD